MATCQTCDGQGEVPTPDTEHLASIRVGGFEHPNLQLTRCPDCDGTGYVTGDDE